MQEELVALLTALGLSRNEAFAYVTLLEEPSSEGCTGYEVAARSGVPRSAVYTVLARLEETGATGFRWRVQLIWPEVPTIDLLLGFDDLGTTPSLIGVGGSPPAPKEATP